MHFRFIPHLIDTSLSPQANYGQTALADLDNDGELEYTVGEQGGAIYWYKRHDTARWTRRLLGEHSPSDVGGVVLDVDGDGWLDFVAGGAWYRNSRRADQPFERIVFDADLAAVHDIRIADIDGDGRPEVITLSDRSHLRWYKIPPEPSGPWTRHDIAPGVHAGLAVGDIDGDGDLDLFACEMEAVPGESNPRYYIWENLDGRGGAWQEHVILDANLGGHEPVVGDILGHGRPDIMTKPWHARPENALGGKMFILLLENVST